MNINELLKQSCPTLSDIENMIGLKPKTLSMYIRPKNPRPIPKDVEEKLITYMAARANFILNNLDMQKKTTEVLKTVSVKKSTNPALVKDKSRYYPSGDGWVHFCIDTDYYMTNDSECTIDGKTYEFNPATKIVGMMSEKYVPTIRPKIDLPIATVQLPDPEIKAFVSTDITLPNTVESKPIDSPLILSKDLFRLDGIAEETAL